MYPWKLTDLEEFLTKQVMEGKTVEAICLGKPRENNIPSSIKDKYIGLPISMESFVALCDFHGNLEAPFYVWLGDEIIFSTEYDSRYNIDSVPRYPISCNPSYK